MTIPTLYRAKGTQRHWANLGNTSQDPVADPECDFSLKNKQQKTRLDLENLRFFKEKTDIVSNKI